MEDKIIRPARPLAQVKLRYAVRAGRNPTDSEFSYHSTVIIMPRSQIYPDLVHINVHSYSTSNGTEEIFGLTQLVRALDW